MEAKDTVIDLRDVANESLRIQMAKILERQAEISFKAGIREVVEWIRNERAALLVLTNYIGWNIWQEKLKEWGLKEEN